MALPELMVDSVLDRICLAIANAGGSASHAEIGAAVNVNDGAVFAIAMQTLSRDGYLLTESQGMYELSADAAALYPPPAAAQSATTTVEVKEDMKQNQDGKRCAQCKASKPRAQFRKWQKRCNDCIAESPPFKQVAVSKKPAPAQQTSVATRQPTIAAAAQDSKSFLIAAAGALLCKVNGSLRPGLEISQGINSIHVDVEQLRELITFGTSVIRDYDAAA